MNRDPFTITVASAALALAIAALSSGGITKKTYEIRDEFTTIAPTCGEVAGAITGYADALYQGSITVKGCVSIRKAKYSATTWVARVLMAGEYDNIAHTYLVYLQYSPFVVTNIGPPG